MNRPVSIFALKNNLERLILDIVRLLLETIQDIFREIDPKYVSFENSLSSYSSLSEFVDFFQWWERVWLVYWSYCWMLFELLYWVIILKVWVQRKLLKLCANLCAYKSMIHRDFWKISKASVNYWNVRKLFFSLSCCEQQESGNSPKDNNEGITEIGILQDRP